MKVWEKDPQKILKKLQKSRGLLRELFESVSEDRWFEVIVGGDWSISDMVVHLIGWDDHLVSQAKVWLSGKIPVETGISDDEYNKAYILNHPVKTKSEAIYLFNKSTADMFSFLNGLTAAEKEYAIEHESLVDLDMYEHDMEHYDSILKSIRNINAN